MMNDRQKISIVGFGRFGKLLYEILKSDFQIAIYDKSAAQKTVKLARNSYYLSKISEIYLADTIFYAVPIDQFESVLQTHSRYLTERHLLIDLLSVKLHPERIFKKYLKNTGARALLTHPMFGPDSVRMKGLAGQPLIMDRFTADAKGYGFWKEYFEAKGLRVVEMEAAQHDRLAARSQGVTHFIGRLLDEYGLKPTLIDSLGAIKLQEVMNQTCNDTWQLFLNLQNYNPYTVKMRDDLGKAYDKLFNKLLPDQLQPGVITFGIQGGRGSFNEEAIRLYIKQKEIQQFKIKYLYTTAKVLEELRKGLIDIGIFAIQNSVGGIVDESVKAMAQYRFKIVEELKMPIQHHLQKLPDVNMSEIRVVMAHDQVFKQCRQTMALKYPNLKQRTGTGNLIDTAACADALRKGKIPKNSAILGCKAISEIYGLEIVESDLQDDSENITSFLIVERS